MEETAGRPPADQATRRAPEGDSGNSALVRRIKKYIWSRTHRFLAICPPGLEPVCRRELEALGVRNLSMARGGVEFEGRLESAYSANLHLRSASRVLMRFAFFRAGAYEELFSRASKLPWETVIDPNLSLSFNTVLRRSRISHSSKAEEALKDAVRRRFQDGGLFVGTTPREPQEIYLRVQENQCLLSLDTTGSHLRFRGYRTDVRRAPLRENLAAGLLLYLDRNPDAPFLDPMCGSGTIPLEAALMAMRRAPGSDRFFAFMNWPSFRQPTWEHLLGRALNAVMKEPPPRCMIFGADVDEDAIAAARDNAGRAGAGAWCSFEQKDFFSSRPPAGKGALAVNPPYGRRVSGDQDLSRFYAEIGAKLRADYGGWKMLVLIPSEVEPSKLGIAAGETIRLDHGGIRIRAVFARVP